MATVNKKKIEVDFLPRIGINNDFMKIYNRMNADMNNIMLINNLLNLLEMREGSNKEFPDIGLAQEFLKLSFAPLSQIDIMLSNIKNTLIEQLGHDGIDLSYSINNPENPQSDITIKISISGIPGNINLDVVSNHNNSRAIATSYAK